MVQKKRNIKVSPRRRQQPDAKRLSRALVALVEAEAEAAAQQQHEQQTNTPTDRAS